jgi:hypothetical protein
MLLPDACRFQILDGGVVGAALLIEDGPHCAQPKKLLVASYAKL